MKTYMTRGVVFLLIALAPLVIYGGSPASGVAEVDVFVKQRPGKRVITDERGNFAFDALSPGSYTLAFRGHRGSDSPSSTASKVTVGTSYSIKIEGIRHSVSQSGLSSDKLLAGIEIAVEVGSGGTIRGQVLAEGLKKWVWIGAETGSHLPGHWADPDSKEAAAHNTVRVRTQDLGTNF